MKASVIISTYNAEAWLEKVLWGYSCQAEKDFELIIADDGSSPATASLIKKMEPLMGIPVMHVWHEDHGFRKTEILNKAILASRSDYLIFSDGDCIPRNDFVQQHIKHRQRGRFLSGGYFKLPMDVSNAVGKAEILSQECFLIGWLRSAGIPSSFRNSKITSRGFKAKLLNFITTTKPSWNGHNASGWKRDIMAVNGFNMDMGYGGEDREFGERLTNYGVLGKQIRYSAICLHLEHERSYATAAGHKHNQIIRKENRRNRVTAIRNGISSVKREDDNIKFLTIDRK